MYFVSNDENKAVKSSINNDMSSSLKYIYHIKQTKQ